MHAAFLLGQLAEQVEAVSGKAVPSLLERAASLVNRPAITLDELRSVGARLQEIENHRGIMARVTGAFSLINLIWLLSILGIAVSIGPSIVHALRPLREYLLRAARYLFTNLIEPVAVRCHCWGLFEAAAWLVTSALLVDASRVFHPDSGVYVAATSASLALGPCFGYSFALWATKLKRGDKETLCSLVGAWACATLVPLALVYDSTLLAYLATFAAYGALGFSVTCHGLCWCVGFRSERAVERVTATSTLLLLCHMALRECCGNRVVGPFDSPLSVVGSLTLYLALLILSSLYYDRRKQRYAQLNALTAAALMLGAGAGWVCGALGLANTATTFTCLWILEKYTEVHMEAKWNGWVLLLLLSLCAYKGALHLHANPAFVASIFGTE